MNTRSVLFSILIAGVVTGLLANLPVLNLINCALCIWVWFGGSLSVFLYRRFQRGGPGLTAKQGASLGALTGLVGALVGAVVFTVTSPLSITIFDSLARAFQVEGDLPFRSNTLWDYLTTTLIFLVVDAVLYPIFGALSGLITANLTKDSQSIPEEKS